MEEVTTIPFEITRVPNVDKPIGYEEVIEDGIDGKRIVTKDEESGQVISDKTTHPKNQVVYFGTAEITSDAPQEEVPKQAVVNTESGVIPSLVLNTDDYVPTQGRDTELRVINKETSMNKSIKKALLEAARLLVFAIPGILITVLTSNPELGGSLGATILLVLKSVDRAIHDNPETPVKGLLPF